MTTLPRIRPGLLKHPLDKQVLVYDTVLDRVHLLDPTTACVLELLEEGGHTEEDITAQIVARLDLAPNAGFLPLAVDELRKADLLDLSHDCAAPMVDVQRRELLRNIALTGVATLLVPTVASLTATRGYAQGTAPNHGVCNTCTDSSQCINSICCNGICLTACTGGAGGQCCNQDGQCASNSCVGGVCTGTTAVGGACSTNINCLSNNCCNGICATNGGACPQPNGQLCTANGQCSSNICCNGVCSAAPSVANCGACTSTCQCTGTGSACQNGVCGNNANKVGVGQPCNGNGNCCSGHCEGPVGAKVCVA